METVVGLFQDFKAADQAVRHLEEAGFRRQEISILAQSHMVQQNLEDENLTPKDVGESAAVGAVSGGAAGGIIGLLAAVGSITIPGLGPAIAAGSLAAILGITTGTASVGAAVGGILGAMSALSIPEDEAKVYAEAVRRGGILVTVKSPESQEENAHAILQQSGAQNVDNLRAELEKSGWSGEDLDKVE